MQVGPEESDSRDEQAEPQGPDENDLADLEAAEVTCHRCGAKVYEEAERCPSCGAEIAAPTALRRLALVVLILLAVLLVLGLVDGRLL